MGSALVAFLIVVGVLVAAVVVIGSVNRSSAYDEIGKRSLLGEQGSEGRRREAQLEQEELLALIAARNERRARRGEPPLELEQELERLAHLEDIDRL